MPDTQRFDRVSSTWDEDAGRVALAQGVADAIAHQVPLSPATAVLDFGCGTGLLTLALQPRVGPVTGADASPGMLQVLDAKIRAQGLSMVTTHLLSEANGYALAGEFDLVVSSMALHHVRDLAPLFADFHARLRAGGHVALADLDVEDGTFHDPDVTDVFHLGFDRGAIAAQLREAGFQDVHTTTAYLHRRRGREYPVFLLAGRKA